MTTACLQALTDLTKSQAHIWTTCLQRWEVKREERTQENLSLYLISRNSPSPPCRITLTPTPSHDVAWRGIPPFGVLIPSEQEEKWIYSLEYADQGDVINLSSLDGTKQWQLVPKMHRGRHYCVCPQAYQNSHRITHIASQVYSHYLLAVTACNRLFVWKVPSDTHTEGPPEAVGLHEKKRRRLSGAPDGQQ